MGGVLALSVLSDFRTSPSCHMCHSHHAALSCMQSLQYQLPTIDTESIDVELHIRKCKHDIVESNQHLNISLHFIVDTVSTIIITT